jgi:hypothetical protein
MDGWVHFGWLLPSIADCPLLHCLSGHSSQSRDATHVSPMAMAVHPVLMVGVAACSVQVQLAQVPASSSWEGSRACRRWEVSWSPPHPLHPTLSICFSPPGRRCQLWQNLCVYVADAICYFVHTYHVCTCKVLSSPGVYRVM